MLIYEKRSRNLATNRHVQESVSGNHFAVLSQLVPRFDIKSKSLGTKLADKASEWIPRTSKVTERL